MDLSAASAGMFTALLARTHLSHPYDVAGVVVEEIVHWLDASDVVVYLADRTQTVLVPMAAALSPARGHQSVDGTMAGRSFTTTSIMTAPAGAAAAAGPEQVARQRAWLPVIDGTDRIGVLELEIDTAVRAGVDDAEAEAWQHELLALVERYAHAVAQLLVGKAMYGDVLEDAQRLQPMSLSAELMWSMVPPLTFATNGLVISAMLEPAYESGGDMFDYAVNGDCTHLAVLDGMGHGLGAAAVAAFAVAAYRHSRRGGLDMPATYAAIDAAVAEQFDGDRFVTAVLAQLDVSTGLLRWVSAGHPEPLLVRDNRVVKVLELDSATPFGVPMFDTEVRVGEEQLQPGDTVLLYTDGVTEARKPGRGFLGVEGLSDFVRREAADGQSPPETLRRLRRLLLERQDGHLEDDATVVMVDWRAGTERSLVPQTVV